MEDRWSWSLSSSGEFSVSSVRRLIDDKTLPDATQKTRWVRLVPIKINVHTWKVKYNSLPTRFNISGRVRNLVDLIVRWWNVTRVDIDSYSDWELWIQNLRLLIKNKRMLEDEVSDEEVELGSVYEVNHKKLHPRTPVQLRLIDSCCYDENFVMGIKLARKVLKRQVPSQEFAEKKHLEGFWLVNSNNTQFGQVMYIGRQKEMPKIPSTSSFVQGEKRRREDQHEINCDCEDEDVEVELLDDNVDKKEEKDAKFETESRGEPNLILKGEPEYGSDQVDGDTYPNLDLSKDVSVLDDEDGAHVVIANVKCSFDIHFSYPISN
ncbi:hypothetical protein Tco_0765814 [Tanacetum coccineum]